eukprot:3932114-Alexandrium_andersonii.AAC.1
MLPKPTGSASARTKGSVVGICGAHSRMRSQLTSWAASCRRRITSSGTWCLAASAVTSLPRSAWVEL